MLRSRGAFLSRLAGIATVAAVVTSLFGESVLASGSGTTLAWGDNSSGQLGGGPGAAPVRR